ncbi:hypothetical protein [Streptomyces sp. NBC_01508]
MAADPHPIVDAPATVAACQADRDAAQGQGAANNQLAEARTEGNNAGGNR